MGHDYLIHDDGQGTYTHDGDNTASVDVKWSPSHTLTPEQEARRLMRARKQMKKMLDDLYADAASDEPTD